MVTATDHVLLRSGDMARRWTKEEKAAFLARAKRDADSLACVSCGGRLRHRTWNDDQYDPPVGLNNPDRCSHCGVTADAGESITCCEYMPQYDTTKEK